MCFFLLNNNGQGTIIGLSKLFEGQKFKGNYGLHKMAVLFFQISKTWTYFSFHRLSNVFQNLMVCPLANFANNLTRYINIIDLAW